MRSMDNHYDDCDGYWCCCDDGCYDGTDSGTSRSLAAVDMKTSVGSETTRMMMQEPAHRSTSRFRIDVDCRWFFKSFFFMKQLKI